MKEEEQAKDESKTSNEKQGPIAKASLDAPEVKDDNKEEKKEGAPK